MIKNVIFTCEKCGRVYNNEEACQKCEQGHLIPVSFGKYEYSGFHEVTMIPHKGTKKHPLTETTKMLAPDWIQIKFSDGLYRTYNLYGTGDGFKPPLQSKKKDA